METNDGIDAIWRVQALRAQGITVLSWNSTSIMYVGESGEIVTEVVAPQARPVQTYAKPVELMTAMAEELTRITNHFEDRGEYLRGLRLILKAIMSASRTDRDIRWVVLTELSI